MFSKLVLLGLQSLRVPMVGVKSSQLLRIDAEHRHHSIRLPGMSLLEIIQSKVLPTYPNKDHSSAEEF